MKLPKGVALPPGVGVNLPKPLERDVQAQVIQYLRLVGGFPVRINSGAFAGEHKGKKRFVRFNSEPGCSDVLCVLPGGTVAAFEVKRPGWKFRPTDPHEAAQASFLERVRALGGVAAFVTGVDDVRAAMAQPRVEVRVTPPEEG